MGSIILPAAGPQSFPGEPDAASWRNRLREGILCRPERIGEWAGNSARLTPQDSFEPNSAGRFIVTRPCRQQENELRGARPFYTTQHTATHVVAFRKAVKTVADSFHSGNHTHPLLPDSAVFGMFRAEQLPSTTRSDTRRAFQCVSGQDFLA